VVAGGDVNLGRGLGKQILRGDQVSPFAAIQPVLGSADLRFVNLESQLSDQGGETQSSENMLIFTGPPGGADVLARARIDVVSLANNHVWDYGQEAFLQTLQNLRRVGVAQVGVSAEPGRMYEPTVLQRDGWSIALFAVTDIWNQGPIHKHRARDHVAWAKTEMLEGKVAAARQAHDIVLLSYHGGDEYLNMPMAWSRKFIRAMMEAGADAVIGHHPHVPHGVGWFGDRPAFYSLGNLVFGMHREYRWTGTSFLARLTFRRSGRTTELEVEACPYRILGGAPVPFDGPAKPALERRFQRHLKFISVTVGGTQIGEPGAHSCMRLAPPEQRRDDRQAHRRGRRRPRGGVPAASSLGAARLAR
jgi:poly-gamma-glutamate synthesis protein (capsule biosynthesis protein)